MYTTSWSLLITDKQLDRLRSADVQILYFIVKRRGCNIDRSIIKERVAVYLHAFFISVLDGVCSASRPKRLASG